MELILQILMLFLLINTLIKLSFWSFWQTALFGVLAALFVVLTRQYAEIQSKTQLADLMQNTALMRDLAVLITLESTLCFAFCIVGLRDLYGKKPKRLAKVISWYPGLFIFPVLFYIQTSLFFSLTGTDFSTISYVLAGVVLLAIPLFSLLIRRLCPEKELRLEFHFLVSLFVCIIGLIATVNGNTTYSAVKEPLNLRSIAFAAAIFLFFFLAGILGDRLKWAIWRKRKNKRSIIK